MMADGDTVGDDGLSVDATGSNSMMVSAGRRIPLQIRAVRLAEEGSDNKCRTIMPLDTEESCNRRRIMKGMYVRK